MLDEMNRQLEETTQWWTEDQPQLWKSNRLPVDILDESEKFVITAELPGYDREEIDIRITDQTLWLEAQKDESTHEEHDRFIQKERRTTTARRSIKLPSPIDADSTEARFHNGILTVSIPKAHAEEETRRIEIDEV